MISIHARGRVKLSSLKTQIYGLEMCLAKRNILVTYKKHESMKDYQCFYCGLHGESTDHVPAVNHAHLYPEYDRLLIRACLLCNSILGGKFLPTLYFRSNYLLRKYRSRLRKLLARPDWTAEEIEELKGKLKRHIILGIKKKQNALLILSRLETLVEILEPEENYSPIE